MEPLFKRDPYKELVPRVLIKAGDKEIDLLDAGHRAADAIVRFSDLAPMIDEAYRAWLTTGDAVPLAKIAPTSILFGSWDSRATQAKLPRIVRSVIRAYNVKVLHRSAQYSTIAGEILEGAEVEVTTKGPKAELGLAHVPAAWTHGGVEVLKEVRRDATLNLVALRALDSDKPEDGINLRRYILGLALVSFTAPQEMFLREGCQLVPDNERPSEWSLVKHDGNRPPLQLTHEDACAFARATAISFGVGEDRTATFDPNLARQALGQSKQERKASRRRGRGSAQTEQSEAPATQTDEVQSENQ